MKTFYVSLILAQLPQMLAAIAQGRTFRLTKGDLTAEVTSNFGET